MDVHRGGVYSLVFVLVHGHEQVVQRFRERRVCKGGVPQRSIREFAHDGGLEYGHDFTAFNAENGCAENLICICVDDGFHEAASFVDFECTSDRSHWELGNADLATVGAGLCFGQTHSTKLRIDEDTVRDLTVLR